MADVALTPGALVDGGRVDLSRPEDSGLRGLAASLDATVRSAADIAQTAQENEFKDISSLLNDATAGPDEIAEIAGNAYFPLNRFAAQNRQGEAAVAAERTAIEDDLVNAKDPIDARMRLRAHQQRIMEGNEELGVQAGIRQAIADMAGPLLNKASAKRVALRNQNRRNDESFILRETLVNEPTSFTDQVKAILSDQELDATQAPDIHATAAQTLLNSLIENPPSVVAVKAAAQDVLASGTVVDAKDRALYGGVLKAVERIEADTATEVTEASEKKRLLGLYGMRIDDHLRAHPGTSIPEEDLQGYLRNSPDPLAARGKIRTAIEASKGATIGLIGTDAHSNGKKSLDRLFATSVYSIPTPKDNAIKAAAYELYDQISGSIDPEITLQPAEASAQAQQAAQVAFDRAKAFAEANENAAALRETRKAEIDEKQMAAVMAGDMATVRRLEAELEQVDSESMLQSRRGLIQGVLDYAEQTGMDINRDLRP